MSTERTTERGPLFPQHSTAVMAAVVSGPFGLNPPPLPRPSGLILTRRATSSPPPACFGGEARGDDRSVEELFPLLCHFPSFMCTAAPVLLYYGPDRPARNGDGNLMHAKRIKPPTYKTTWLLCLFNNEVNSVCVARD